ncbi:type II toxin-antitoxin system PemK/MazF family toxin [Bowdeniella massiliensis]|uniref:type II toxin-antitoxin system PemK/MazF family toxin n=1 Tax=Bowdeniella massiliensis TaxID=2932264 RepID=UPI002028590F
MNSLFRRGLRLVSQLATDALKSSRTSASPRRVQPAPRASATIGEYDTTRGLPRFEYSPELDGDADPGEVVWTWVPYEEDATQGKDRPVLVLARESNQLIIAQLTSKDHDRDADKEARYGRYWMDVGSGVWDRRGRPSEVRLDRLLWVSPDVIRREGGRLDKPIFDAVTDALISLHQG